MSEISYSDIDRIRNDARLTLERADTITRQAARIVSGRLRSSGVPPYVLEELKRELRDYNMHTGEWKQR